ncbi:MAG: type I-U CRISPR-associated helicase/endonuclease Cas3 [Desulfobacteraceae bacterium]|nr:MAG: type I-U CRISPR-associated helicase/endonuclease Cas3 [Desulfobacteraceae bacterium]
MSFTDFFCAATGNRPFPWQTALYEKFSTGQFPTSANIPTGLGKTSIVAVWLIALALYPHKVPRRLVYVVNRRTVVDQTTAEVEKLRMALSKKPELKEIVDKLLALCALPLPAPDSPPLAVSTLRGQFADNREWSADPARPAVIVGTVDMIGSGLLFSRYTAGFKLRPHHAAFLAQDVLLVHDEAHLEPAFQQLLNSVVGDQKRSNDPRQLWVIELSATTRLVAPIEPFRISKDDEKNEFVNGRLNAVKHLSCVALTDGEKLPVKISALALEHKDSGRAVLVFIRSVEHATKIAAALDKGGLKGKVLTLTGTMRGKERDDLVKKPVFQRFLPESSLIDDAEAARGTVFLVATSAGEVGVNISADDLVCDLSTYESMAQRFGRVNRFGKCDDSSITVVYPQEFPHTKKISDAEKAVADGKKDAEKKLRKAKESSALDIALENTLELLHKLGGDASPTALEQLPAAERAAAFSPQPKMRVATDVQFDAWALTSIRDRIAARPPVAPYLHGEAEWEPPETHIAWREDVDVIKDELLNAYAPEELLADFPLKPHEFLRDVSSRVLNKIASLAAASSDKTLSMWLIPESGEIKVLPISRFASAFDIYSKGSSKRTPEEKREVDALKAEIEDATMILPASLGGIKKGLLSAESAGNSDVTDVSEIENMRLRIHAPTPDIPEPYAERYRLIRSIDTKSGEEEDETESPRRYWLWLEAKKALNAERRTAQHPETLADHTEVTIANAAAIAEKLLPAPTDGEPDLRRCLIAAAELHDLGKNRRQWQFGIGNTTYDSARQETILAKSGGAMHPRNLTENYRHEFGSIADAPASADFAGLTSIERDIVLHLVAAHHGRARPHFPAEEIFDYNAAPDVSTVLAAEVPRRFARLQHTFGRWGLAWLESLLRAADYAASAGIVAIKPAVSARCLAVSRKSETETLRQKDSETVISLRVDVANPGQYFACCGLFELATRLARAAMAHFEQDCNSKQWRFVISNCIIHDGKAFTLHDLLTEIVNAKITNANTSGNDDSANDENSDTADNSEDDAKAPPLQFGPPFDSRLDWWETADNKTAALKVWAGSMDCLGIATAMQNATRLIINESDFLTDARGILSACRVVYEPASENSKSKKPKKKEPFYFDAKRGPNADSRDVGFAPNDLSLQTIASPAVELLCLVGLQRTIPAPAQQRRQFVYTLWTTPLPISLLAAAVNGQIPESTDYSYRFESWFRTSQKKHKAFLQATLTKRTNK